MPHFARIFVNDNHRSICKKCFRTVGESIKPEDLTAKEHEHACDWHDVLRYQMTGREDASLRPAGRA